MTVRQRGELPAEAVDHPAFVGRFFGMEKFVSGQGVNEMFRVGE